jgi:hypothetical protein
MNKPARANREGVAGGGRLARLAGWLLLGGLVLLGLSVISSGQLGLNLALVTRTPFPPS